MIDWLYSLPDWLLLVACAAVLAGLITVLPLLTHRLPWLSPDSEKTDFVLRLQATLFTATSFVIAFTLVEAESNYRKVDAFVSAEASSINRLDRLLVRYGHQTADQSGPTFSPTPGRSSSTSGRCWRTVAAVPRPRKLSALSRAVCWPWSRCKDGRSRSTPRCCGRSTWWPRPAIRG